MKKTRLLVVGGRFGDNPKASIFLGRMVAAFRYYINIGEAVCCNGGSYEELDIIFNEHVPKSDLIVWIPDVDNSRDKYVQHIKVKNPSAILISSKRLEDRNMIINDLIGIALKNKSNLILGIHPETNPIFPKLKKYRTIVLDPLGNNYYSGTSPDLLLKYIAQRAEYLLEAVRTKSVRDQELNHTYKDDGFISVVKDFGDRFSQFADQVNPNRLMGNASTRCSCGFPSHKKDGVIFVSKRNGEKSTLCGSDMVPTQLKEVVYYGGPNKPSVDSAIQLKLYQEFPDVKYMIHGHCYILHEPMTTLAVPCGDLREVDQIKEAIKKNPNGRVRDGYMINLRGHGCLIMAKNLDFFSKVRLIPRPFPENI